MERKKDISQAVINRIPRYYRYISELKSQNIQRISSKELASIMGLTASQIRQDLNCFGGFGQQGYGYNVSKLRDELGEILGLSRNKRAIIVGVGNIGKALIKNFNFSASGFSLVGAFDKNPEVIGRQFDDITVRDISELEDYVKEEKPDIAVLTIPKFVAPQLAEMLIKNGIKGLWNFTNQDLTFNESDIPIENVHFSDSLMTLCFRID